MSEAPALAICMIGAGCAGMSAPCVAAKKYCVRSPFPPPTAKPAH